MRLLVVAGGPAAAAEIAEGLRPRGHAVAAFAPAPPHETAPETLPPLGRVLETEAANQRAFLDRLGAERPDLAILVRMRGAPISLEGLARAAGIPTVLVATDHWLATWESDPWVQWWRRMTPVERRLARLAGLAPPPEALDLSRVIFADERLKTTAIRAGLPVEGAPVGLDAVEAVCAEAPPRRPAAPIPRGPRRRLVPLVGLRRAVPGIADLRVLVRYRLPSLLIGLRRGAAGGPRRVRGILIVHLAEIGDVVLASALIRETRRAYPEAWIGLVVQPVAFPLVEMCPHVDGVFAFPWRDAAGAGMDWNAWTWWRRAARLRDEALGGREIDLAIVPRSDEYDPCRAAAMILAHVCGARRRVGFRGAWRLARALLADGPEAPRSPHALDAGLEVLEHIGVRAADRRPEVWTTADDERAADEALRRAGVSAGPLAAVPAVAMAPGARVRLVRWPEERFAEVARWLATEAGAAVVLVGGPDESDLCARIAAAAPGRAANLAGRGLREMAAVLRRCRLFVGNNSGPAHIARAVGIPVVEIFGPRDHRRFETRGPAAGRTLRVDLPCSPCGDLCRFERARCLEALAVEEVRRACADLLRPAGGPAPTILGS